MTKSAGRTLHKAFLRDRGRLTQLSRALADREAGDEAVQELWLRIETMEAGPQIRNPGSYLSRMLVNLLRSGFRRDRTRQAAQAEMQAILEGTERISAERRLAAREGLAQVGRALDELPARTRDIFLMNRVEGLTYRQIAGAMSVSEQTVHYHMRRAMDHLLPLREVLGEDAE